MNIYVYNCPNTYNYGSMMMGENFISYFNNISQTRNKYYVETEDETNIVRLREATGYDRIYAVKMDAPFKEVNNKYEFLYGYFGVRKLISEFINELDLVVVLGGDDFTEDYGWKSPVLKAIKFNLIKRAKLDVIMFGQTMGPYSSFRKPVMKKLLSNITKIYPRDPITYDYLNKLGLKNIDITDDLALLPLTLQETKERTKEYITYCASELIFRYSKEGDRNDWIEFNLFMIELIMSRYPEKKLVLIAHVLKPEDADDRKITKELYNLVKEKYSDRIIFENNEIYPYQVRNYIQQSLFTISSRMHPIVSSIQCGIPAIALSYSSKYWGIIGERYDLSDYILDIRFLSYDEMKKGFINRIELIELEYEQINRKMVDKNKQAKETIMKSLNELVAIRGLKLNSE